MNLTVALFIAFIVTVVGGLFVFWKALDGAVDFIVFLGKVVAFFVAALPGLRPSQIFNILVDVIIAVGVVCMTLLLNGSGTDIFHSILVFVGAVLTCLVVSVFAR